MDYTFFAFLSIILLSTQVLGRLSKRIMLPAVALIMAQKGLDCGLLSETLFAPVILVVLVTTLASPILLNFVMKDNVTKDKGRNGLHRVK